MKRNITLCVVMVIGLMAISTTVNTPDSSPDAWIDAGTTTKITQTINLAATHAYGGNNPTDNANYENVLAIGGVGPEKGLKIYKQNSGGGPTFTGSANWSDAYVFEMTDANGNTPDGGIVFGGTGKDDVFDNIMTIRGNGRVGIDTHAPQFKFQTNGDIYANGGWVRVAGDKGLYFQNRGGGFRMTDNTWIRTYGNKSFYHNSGIMRTDGTFQVGHQGERFVAKTNGRIGIGVKNPGARLHLNTLGLSNNDVAFRMGGNSKFVIDAPGVIGGRMTVLDNGNTGFGTVAPEYKVDVNGTLRAGEIIVEDANFPDFVFSPEYECMSLDEKLAYVKKYQHLPSLEDAHTIKTNGLKVQQTINGLTQELEEQLLYTSEMKNELDKVKEQYGELKADYTELKSLLNQLIEKQH